MKRAAVYFCAMLLGLLLSGPVAADVLATAVAATAGDSGRPLKAAAHEFDPARPYWLKAIPGE